MCRRKLLLSATLLLSCVVLGGCYQQPISETLFFSYNQTKIGQTDSAQELTYIQMSQMTLLSKSDTVIASWGQAKDGYQEWLNVTAFNEATGLAVRKYFFFVDEKAHHIPFLHPEWTAQFNGQLILDKTVLEKPYASQNARSIAILKEIQKQFADDIAKVSSDNKSIGTCQMVVNESFEQLQILFADSPEWASKLDMPEGVTFEHRSFYKGIAHLRETEGGITEIAIHTGSQPTIEGKLPNPYDPNSGVH
jgi:hypothetical protein